jgi:hypothetical protein
MGEGALGENRVEDPGEFGFLEYRRIGGESIEAT